MRSVWEKQSEIFQNKNIDNLTISMYNDILEIAEFALLNLTKKNWLFKTVKRGAKESVWKHIVHFCGSFTLKI